MNKNYFGNYFNVGDLYDLSDESIFIFYQRRCYPFSIFIRKYEFIRTKNYGACKLELVNVIRKQKLNKLLGQ